jgi:flagellar hook-basal body complex protein FliE
MAAPISNATPPIPMPAAPPAPPVPPRRAGGESFAALLKEAAGDVGDALHKSEAASLQAVTGKPDSRRSPPRSTIPRRRSPSS